MTFSALRSIDVLPKRLFIEASAGTGKTFSIIHLICQYILKMATLGEELSFSEVACLTFTRAVAREMRVRLKETLGAIREALEQKKHTGWEYVDELFDRPTARTASLRAVRQALFDLDRAHVSTFHLFADKLMNEWKEKQKIQQTGTWLGPSDVRTWLIDLLEHGEQDGVLSLYEWKACKKYFRSNSKRALSWLVEYAHSDQKEEPLQDLLAPIRKRTKELFCSQEELLEALLHMAGTLQGTMNVKKELKPDVVRYLSSCVDLLYQDSLEPLWSIYSSSFSYSKIFSEKKKKNVQVDPQKEALFLQFVEQILPSLFSILDVSSVVYRVGRLLHERLYEFISKKAYKTPDFLIHTFQQLSLNADFVSFVRLKFRLVIVDEFQDTDPVQWTILERIFHERSSWNGSLYVVGDPKQSIYRFRGADMSSYIAAKSSFLEEECVSLSTNFRATSLMVHAINTLFSTRDAPNLFLVPSLDEFLLSKRCISAETLTVRENREEGPTPIECTLFVGTGKRRWPSLKEEEQSLFPWLLSSIAQEARRGVSFNGMAVLVKDRYQAERVRRLLKKNNISSLLRRSELVTHSAAYMWLLAALRVVISPKKRQPYSDMLLSYPTEETLQAAERLTMDTDPFFFAQYVSSWQEGRSVYHREGISGLLRHILCCPMVEGKTVEGWIDSLEESFSWRLDLEQLLELIERVEKARDGLEMCVRHLEELESLFEEDTGPLIRRADPDDRAVSIMTLHSSKGLEFQSVFLLGAAVRSMYKKEETMEDVAEKVRQFYVAVTRAKERCYLPIPILETPAASVALSVVETYFAHRGSGSIQEQVDSLVQTSSALFEYFAPETKETFQKNMVAPELYTFGFKNWNLPQSAPIHPVTFSALHKKTVLPFFPKDSSTAHHHGTLWGIRLHQACADVLKLKIRPVTQEVLRSMCPGWSVSEGDVEVFIEELWGILNAPIVFGRSALELPPSSLFIEQPFYLFRDGHPFFGTFDLLVLFEGHIWVIDWKTNEEARSDRCQTLHELVYEAGYDLQASLYKEAALQSGRCRWGGFSFVFSKHASCPICHGVVEWKI